MSMKPKVALVKDGFLPAGSENKRGRLSGDAIERLKKLAAQGWDIEGYSVTKSADTSKPVTVEKVAVDPNRIADVPDEARAEELWEAYRFDNGKPFPVSMRTVCNGCKSSLTYCHCEHPRVWVDHKAEAVVRFKPRSKPLPRVRW